MRSDFWRHFDFLLLGGVILANAFGVAMIRSAIAGNEVLAGLVNRQIIYASLGLVLIFVFALIDYHYWAATIRPIYLLTMLFLLVLFVVGQVTFGAVRWIETGLISIQPTEIAKIVVILALAQYFDRTQDSPRDFRWLLTSGLIAGGLALPIFLQPNLSNVIVIMVIWAAMVFVNGVQWRHVAIAAALGIVILAVGIFAPFSPLQEYQRQRVFTFIFPDTNARHGATYNVEQALVAIGSGGWTGRGYGHGTQTQLRFLKVRHTDFIFSATSEEFGFLGTVLLLALLGFIIYRIFRAARLARDQFGSMICFGVGVLMFFQAAVNVAVNLNLIPVTGLPLPFISYGGSGLVSLMAGIGLVESVALRHKPLEF
jgi:rod shape determining protein RodA